MGDEETQLPTPMKHLADDLGIKPSELSNVDLESVFKTGPAPMLFLTRVGHVYTQNDEYKTKNKELKREVKTLQTELTESRAQVVALQKKEIELQKDNEYLATKTQNSIPGIILFSIGSIFIGACGGHVNAGEYLEAGVLGLLGIGTSVLAGAMIIRKK